jgi:probable HAF family extracellular repeat protein
MLLLTAAPSAALEQGYLATDLRVAASLTPVALNNRGQILLNDALRSATLSGPASMFWDEGRTTSIGLLPQGRFSMATGLNDAGQVVGTADTVVTWELPENRIVFRAPHAFVWQGGGLRDLDPSLLTMPDGTPFRYLPGGSFGMDINNHGQVVGMFHTGAPDPNSETGLTATFHAFRTAPGSPIARPGDDLNAGGAGVNVAAQALLVNNRGQVVGIYQVGEGTPRWFFYDGGATPIAGVPPRPEGSINDLNDAGEMAGQAAGRAVVLKAGGGRRELFPSGSSAALGINNAGQVVGWFDTGSGRRAFLAERDLVIDLNDRLPAGSGWVLQSASAINDKGQIAGVGVHQGRAALFRLEPLDLSLALRFTPGDRVCSGEAVTAILRLAQPAPLGGLTVELESVPALADLPESIFFAAGEQEHRFEAKTPPTTTTTIHRVTAAVNNEKGNVLSIVEATLAAQAPELTELKLAADEVCSDDPTTGTVTLSCPAPPQGIFVILQSRARDPALVSVPGSVKVEAGKTSATFPVTPGPYKSLSPEEEVTITADYAGVIRTRKLTIEPTLDALLLPERAKGGETLTAVIQLNCPAPSPGRVVVVASDDTGVAYVNRDRPDQGISVLLAPGATSITIPVYTRTVDRATEVTIRATTLTSSEDAELTVTPAE